jgi:hypothetical protein
VSNGHPFTVYVGREIRGEFPVVVIASGKETGTGHTLFSERFICLYAKDDNKYFPRRLNQRAGEQIRKALGIDEAFMAKQALEEARFSLGRYFDEKYPTNDDLPYDKRDFNLQETNASYLVGLYLRGFFEKELKLIREQTLSDDLRRFISEILELSKFVSNDKI